MAGKGRPKTGGRRAGTPNKKTIARAAAALKRPESHVDALRFLSRIVRGRRPNLTEELRTRAAIALASYQHPHPTPPRAPTFAPKPFNLNKLTTLEDAGAEAQRIAAAVAAGELDHDTGTLLVNAVRTFMDSTAAIKAEREIALADAANSETAS
jgi:hypothetical protein